MPKHWNRRRFLRGVLAGGTATVGLPWLEALGGFAASAEASGDSGFPKRFGLFYWGNGVLPDKWIPDEVGADYSLSPQLEGLSRHQQKLLVLTGYAVNVPNTVPHLSGAAGLLSAQTLIEGVDGDTFAGPSIDQVIAESIGSDTLFRSLQTAATQVKGLSYNGPYARNPPVTDPYDLYQRLFGDTFVEPGSEGLVDPRLGLRRSALDAVLVDIDELSKHVSVADRIRLDQHTTGVRELERRLAKLEEAPPVLDACVRPIELTGDFSDQDGRPQIAERNDAVTTLLAMAFACDQTRVFSHAISDPVDNVLFPGISTGHHELTHSESGDQPEVDAITRFCVDQFAVLLDKLDGISEGEGTVLDHCVILGCSEVSLGQTHSLDEMPILLAGGSDGYFQTGLHHRSDSLESTTNVLIGLQRSVGMNVADFGTDDAYSDKEVVEVLK